MDKLTRTDKQQEEAIRLLEAFVNYCDANHVYLSQYEPGTQNISLEPNISRLLKHFLSSPEYEGR